MREVDTDIEYYTTGVCAKIITFTLTEQGTIHNLKFSAGCNGNTNGLSRMVEGMSAQEVVKRLKDTPCKDRGTSCPDQFARAVEEALLHKCMQNKDIE